MGFKEAINEYGKQITASFVYDGVLYKDDQILRMNPHYEGSLLRTVMKCLDIELDRELLEDTSAIVGLAVAGQAVVNIGEETEHSAIKSPRFGVKAPGDADYSYIEYGTYLIKESKQDEENKTISLECYDLMLQSMIPYSLSIDYEQGVTVKDLLDAICERLSWEKGYTTFRNCDMLIDEEKYDKSDTFRDVLDDIAEVAGGMIGFVDDALTVIYPTSSGEVIDEDNLKSLVMGKKYGPINSVVLSRAPQEDNIYKQDEDSIAANGMTEIRIENNQLIDSDTRREEFIDGICEALFGLSFEIYELESFGIGYLNFGEFFSIKTADGVEHKALMLCDDLQINQGVTESIKLEEPEVTNTDYSAASTTDKTLKKTIMRVDKQENKINALVSSTEAIGNDVDGVKTQMAELVISSQAMDLKFTEAIENIDGASVKETGYRFDRNGLNIHREGDAIHNKIDHTGMTVLYNNEERLVANDKGVTATDLKANGYLIIGDHARFEQYQSNRTACFHIGG